MPKLANELLLKHLPEIARIAGFLAQRWRAERDDVFQELALTMILNGKDYDPGRGSLQLWLTWRWQNILRRRDVFNLLSDEILDVIIVDRADPAQIVADRDQFRTVNRALEKLSPTDREILQSCYGFDSQHEKTLTEISEQMCCSPQWISRRRTAAIHKLRAHLTPPPHIPVTEPERFRS